MNKVMLIFNNKNIVKAFLANYLATHGGKGADDTAVADDINKRKMIDQKVTRFHVARLRKDLGYSKRRSKFHSGNPSTGEAINIDDLIRALDKDLSLLREYRRRQKLALETLAV